MRKRENGDSPATQHDLVILAGEMTRRFDVIEQGQESMRGDIARLEQRQASMKADIARLERGQQAMLGVLQSIDEHFRDHRNYQRGAFHASTLLAHSRPASAGL